MIRRPSGQSFQLISQHDHAIISAKFVPVFGHDPDHLYDPPADPKRLALAASLHDDGWREPDSDGSLNADGLPIDVFDDLGRDFYYQTWTRSAERAAEIDPYAGLLVSLHFTRFTIERNDRWDTSKMSPGEQFALAEYQQEQSELRERLRAECGLRTDITTEGGLAVGDAADDPKEQRLTRDFQLLRAFDLLSLCVCRAELPTTYVGPLPRREGGPLLPVRIEAVEADHGEGFTLHPWPFRLPWVELRVPYIEVPQRTYGSRDELVTTMGKARRSSFDVTLMPRPRGSTMAS